MGRSQILSNPVLNRRIVPIAKEMSYLKAIEVVAELARQFRAEDKEAARLPSNTFHDDILVLSKEWQKIKVYPEEVIRGISSFEDAMKVFLDSPEYSFYPIAEGWAREAFMCPGKDGVFRRGHDIVDSLAEQLGWRSVIFPASLVPEEAIGRKGIGLFVDPLNIESNDNRIVILANSITTTIVRGISEGYGKVDPKTRMPLQVSEEQLESLPFNQKRYFFQHTSQTIGFLSRSIRLDSGRMIIPRHPDMKRQVTFTEAIRNSH